MASRWSKLQKRIYNLMVPSTKFQIHMAIYEMNSNYGYHGNKLPRYWASIGKDIVFDYPKDFDTTEKYGFNSYPWDTDIPKISDLIEEYIQRPRTKLMCGFENDRWGLTDILLTCDKRMGRRRLRELRERIDNPLLIRIINERLDAKYHE